MGLAFKRTVDPPAHFSIGVHAPNSSKAGKNSVRLSVVENAQGVQQEAAQSSSASDQVTVGTDEASFTASGRHHDPNGAWNYILGRFFSA